MTDGPTHDHEPDQAALDELLRAFADEPDDETDVVADVSNDVSTDLSTDVSAGAASGDGSVDVDELVIVEQAPMVDEWDQHLDEPGDDGSPPHIIRIDDYSGTTRVVDASEPRPDAPGDAGSPPEASSSDRIVISIDDELPDAVYVEGSLDGDARRSIVFIDDDDTGDTLEPESERDLRRGIEPRMRERRMAVRRAQSRKRLLWLALIFLVVLLIVAGLAVLGSSLFAIRADQVTVTGNVYTDDARLQAVIDELVGTPVLVADTQSAERELEAIPWVDDARVRTDFPHAVSIEIREREAISTYQGPDGRFRVLDREGRVLDLLDGYPLAYVLLGGPDPVDLEPGEFAPRGYAAASELARNLTGSVRLPNRVEMIEVAADGSRLVMRLNDGTEVRFGEARDLFAKLVRLETVLTSDESREPGVIDVSTREVTR